jgi:hypothetical protein
LIFTDGCSLQPMEEGIEEKKQMMRRAAVGGRRRLNSK